MNELKRCFDDRSLRKIPPEPQLAQKSLKRALKVLEDIPKALSVNLLELAEQRLYQAVFHGIKALLYKDGIKERSHYCVSVYFKETYQNSVSPELITLLDRLRDIRHESQYGLESPQIDVDDIKNWMKEAQELLKVIQRLLGEPCVQ